MRGRYEIIPGESIGPFRLGMTRKEVEALNIRPMKSIEDGTGTVFASIGVIVRYDKSGKCSQIEVYFAPFPFAHEHEERFRESAPTYVLAGRDLNHTSEHDVKELFGSISPDIEISYGGFALPSAGLRASKWESSDDFIYSLMVAPRAARKA
jgi:hypothetical protein